MCASCHIGRPVDVSGQFRRGLAGVRAMVEVGAERGVAAETCLRGTGISLDAAEVLGEQEQQVAANLVDAVGPVPGLGGAVGRRIGLREYGVWGFALLTSPTLGHAIELGFRYLPLTYVMTGLRMEITSHEVRLVVEDTRPFLVERELATISGIVEAILGEAPFHVERNALVADAAVLESRLPHADPLTMAACEQACHTLLQRRSPASTAKAVRRIVAEGTVDSDEIAARLHLSTRTLRRRLADEHTSVRRLVEETRRAAAFSLLAKGTTVEQVAIRLGYTDAATFIRAFRRWTGTTPGAFTRSG